MSGCESLATKSEVYDLEVEMIQLKKLLGAIREEVDKKLNSSEKDGIIQAGAAAGVVSMLPKLKLVESNLDTVRGVANGARGWIDTTGNVIDIKTARNAQKINRNFGYIRDVGGKIGNVAKSVAANAGQIASLLGIVALFAVLQATLIAVQKRIDKNNEAINDLNDDYTKLTSIIGKNKVAIANNNKYIKKNEELIRINRQQIQQNYRDIGRVERSVADANNRSAKADGLARSAITENGRLRDEISRLEDIINSVNPRVNQAENNALEALRLGRQSANKVNQLDNIRDSVTATINRIEELKRNNTNTNNQAKINADGLIVTRRTLGKVTTSQNQLDVKFDGLASKVTNFSTNPNNVTNPGSSTNTRPLTEFNAQLEALKNTQADQAKKIENLGNQKPVDTKQFESLQRQIGGLSDDITTSLLVGLTPTLTRLNNQTAPNALRDAASEAVCRSTGKGGCMNNNVLKPLQRGQNNLLDKFDLLGLGNLAGQLGDLALLQTINTKLGVQIPGGISGFMQKAWSFTKVDKILNVMNLAVNLHNATMLSRNIGETLGDAVSNALSAIGIKDAEGDAIDVNDVISQGITNLITSIIGTANYEALLTRWAKANRIYEASTNLLSNVQSMLGSMEEITEQTGVDVSRIGNALRDSGTVELDSYEYMSEERRGFTKVFDALEKGEELADSFLNITSEIRDFTEEVQDFNENKEELAKIIKEEVDEVNRIEERADNRIEDLPVPSEADKVQS